MSRVKQRLEADGFNIIDNVTYRSQTFKRVAKRTRFQLEYFGFAAIYLIFAEFFSLDRASLRNFSAKCLRYARKSRIIPFLPCIPFHSVICFPVAIVDSIDAATAEAVRNARPPQHFVDHEILVICDLTARRLYYSEKTPYWGTMFYDHFREIIRNTLSP